jgi:V/A-type H+/Na+-transporting ATPase subunit A
MMEQASRLEQLVRLVGAQALPERQRWILDSARLFAEGFLQQNALNVIDAHCAPEKQAALLRLFVEVHQTGKKVLEAGVPLARIRQALDIPRLVRLKESVSNERFHEITQLFAEKKLKLEALGQAQRSR